MRVNLFGLLNRIMVSWSGGLGEAPSNSGSVDFYMTMMVLEEGGCHWFHEGRVVA